MIILGIDPGSSGGIAIIENKINSLPKIIYASRMSVVSLFGKKNSRCTKNFLSP